MTGWRPTAAHLRALVGGTVLAVLGLLSGRGDLVVVAMPLALLATWAGMRRPTEDLVATGGPTVLTVNEGEEFVWEGSVTGVPHDGRVVSFQPGQRYLEVEPPDGAVHPVPAEGPVPIRYDLQATRWGKRTLGGVAVAGYDRFYAWRWGPVRCEPMRLAVLPIAQAVDARAPAPHPRGLVGQERASRNGEGTEFSRVRPFQAGDRLRRIHWPVSARSGQLHVTATHADEDTRVVLLLDALNDVGSSEGLGGYTSSMDLTVRSAATLSQHFLRRGDRVGLRVFGAWGIAMLPARSGQVQLRRILDALALVEPGTARGAAALSARQGLGAGTLVLLLSPLIEPAATQQVAILHRAGLDVVVVDTLPPSEGAPDTDAAGLAWRIRMLERRLEMDRLESLGIPVVPWTGPHSLDTVLLDLSRRAKTPRLVAK